MDFPFGSLIGAAGNILGGLIGGSAQSNANSHASDAANNALAKQEEFQRNQIRWRANDVMAAYKETGIHPLALLGVSGGSYSPVIPAFQNNNPVGEGLSRAGQEIGRAIDATASEKMRLAHAARLDAITVERGMLENESLKLDLASKRARMLQVGPAVPSLNQRYLVDGQGQAKAVGNSVKDVPMKRVTPGAELYNEPGAVTDVGFTKTSAGEHAVVPSEDAMKRMSNDFLGMLMWNIRNRIYPAFGLNQSPPYKLGVGWRWSYNPWTQSYYPTRAGLKGRAPYDTAHPEYDERR